MVEDPTQLASQGGIGALANDALVGKSHNQAVLAVVELVLVLGSLDQAKIAPSQRKLASN